MLFSLPHSKGRKGEHLGRVLVVDGVLLSLAHVLSQTPRCVANSYVFLHCRFSGNPFGSERMSDPSGKQLRVDYSGLRDNSSLELLDLGCKFLNLPSASLEGCFWRALRSLALSPLHFPFQVCALT